MVRMAQIFYQPTWNIPFPFFFILFPQLPWSFPILFWFLFNKRFSNVIYLYFFFLPNLERTHLKDCYWNRKRGTIWVTLVVSLYDCKIVNTDYLLTLFYLELDCTWQTFASRYLRWISKALQNQLVESQQKSPLFIWGLRVNALDPLDCSLGFLSFQVDVGGCHLHMLLLVKEAMNTLRLVHTTPCLFPGRRKHNRLSFFLSHFPKRDKGGTYIQILPHLLCDWVKNFGSSRKSLSVNRLKTTVVSEKSEL